MRWHGEPPNREALAQARAIDYLQHTELTDGLGMIYQDGQRPYNQLVEARFNGVKDLRINFSGHPYEWAINGLSLSEASRSRDDGKVEACFKGALLQNRLEDGQTWVLHEDMSFTFKSCVLGESEQTERSIQ